MLACVVSLGLASCGKKAEEAENLPPKPDKGGRVPMTNQGTIGNPGGGSGQVAEPSTE